MIAEAHQMPPLEVPAPWHRLEVEAPDLRGNKGRLHLPFTIANNL